MPSDFPIKQFSNVYWDVDKKKNSCQGIWGQYRDAWKAVAFRFLSCAGHDVAYTQSVVKYTNSPSDMKERYNQEHHLFAFFFSGLAALESLHYALFAVGALVEPSKFSMASEADLKSITPSKTARSYSETFPGDMLSNAMDMLVKDATFMEWIDVRNILSHRTAPGRTFHAAAHGEDGGKATWLHGINIDDRTTSSRRLWLSKSLSDILQPAETFTRAKF